MGLGCLAAATPADQRDEFVDIRAKVGRPVRGELLVHVLAADQPAPLPSTPDTRAARVTPNLRAIRHELVRVIRALGAFESVGEGDMTGREQPRRVGDAPPRYVLTVIPRRSEIEWTGMHGSWPLSFFVWSLSGPPGWLIPDEVYEARTAWAVTFAEDGATKPLAATELARSFTATLNDIDRGWSFWDALCYYSAPIDGEVLQHVGGKLLPHVQADASLALCEWLARDAIGGLPRVEVAPEPEPPPAPEPSPEPSPEPAPDQRPGPEPEPEPEPQPTPTAPDPTPPVVGGGPAPDPVRPTVPPAAGGARTRLLCIGVEQYGADAPVAFAAADARLAGTNLARALGLDAADVTVLVDGDASAQAVREWFDKARADKFGAADRLWVYFAGRGATDAAGEPYLLTVAGSAADPGNGGLKLADLGRAVERLGTVTLLLDCAFLGRREERGPDAEQAPRAADVVLPRNVRALAAAWDEGEAASSGALGHGLFTAFLCEALSGAADGDGDRVVTFAEALAHLAPRVTSAARRRGVDQRPRLVAGDPAATLCEMGQ